MAEWADETSTSMMWPIIPQCEEKIVALDCIM